MAEDKVKTAGYVDSVSLVDKLRFYSSITDAVSEEHYRYNIGTLKEKKLHIILKKYFEPDMAYHEVPVNSFIADICRDGVIIEIETSGFCGLRPKLEAYLDEYKVILVHPLAGLKYISWINPETGDISKRSKSPKKEGIYELLFEMVYILPYIGHKNLIIAAPVLEIDEYRMLNGWSRDKKRGSKRYERIPADILSMIVLKSDSDYAALIPEACAENFTASEFAKGAKIKLRCAYAVIKVLLARGVIAEDGKRGRSRVYSKIKI